MAHREETARTKVRRFEDEPYWGRAVPGFGDPEAGLLIVGLAPAAHGANRTGRMFTGDRSGDWLYRALHRAGFASQPTAISRGDGLELRNARVTAVVHCAPPDNRPSREERDRCVPFLEEEIRALSNVRVIVALGGFAWENTMRCLRALGDPPPSRTPFSHGGRVKLASGRWILGSYHPSQQNTFTGRLTEAMLNGVFTTARGLLRGPRR